MVQRQFLVGSDLSFPVIEVGCGLTDSEIPRLVWDDSLSSDKGEEAFTSVDITPLALWDPNGVRDLVTLEDDSNGSSMEEELEPSEWGENNDQRVWYFCGIPHCLLRETVY